MKTTILSVLCVILISHVACSSAKKGATSATSPAPAANGPAIPSPFLMPEAATGIRPPGDAELTVMQARYGDVTMDQLNQGHVLYTTGSCVGCHPAKNIYKRPEMNWIDRTFNFDFPAVLMPNMLERLKGTHARIREIASGISDADAQKKIDGKWSLKEQIGHLSDLEELHTRRIDDFLARKEILCAADMTNAETNKADHNSRSISDLMAEFAHKRSILVSGFEKLDHETQQTRSLHPRLKVQVRPVDIAYFTAEHDDHHLVKMREILRRLLPHG